MKQPQNQLLWLPQRYDQLNVFQHGGPFPRFPKRFSRDVHKIKLLKELGQALPREISCASIIHQQFVRKRSEALKNAVREGQFKQILHLFFQNSNSCSYSPDQGSQQEQNKLAKYQKAMKQFERKKTESLKTVSFIRKQIRLSRIPTLPRINQAARLQSKAQSSVSNRDRAESCILSDIPSLPQHNLSQSGIISIGLTPAPKSINSNSRPKFKNLKQIVQVDKEKLESQIILRAPTQIPKLKLKAKLKSRPKNKVQQFYQMLFKINYVAGIFYQPFHLGAQKTSGQYSAFVGEGNNSQIVKLVVRRRPWFKLVQTKQQANLIWTQLKVKHVFKTQTEAAKRTNLNQIIIPKPAKKQRFGWWTKLGKQLFDQNQLIIFNATQTLLKKRISSFRLRVPEQMKMTVLSLQQAKKKLVSNHLQGNQVLNDKKRLLQALCMSQHVQIAKIIPLSYHVQSMSDIAANRLAQTFSAQQKKGQGRLWIVKPGQKSNRGRGIFLVNSYESLLKKISSSQQKSFVIQKYIQRPLLYNGRKFDIRHYAMITSTEGQLRAYWSKLGYIRTSSEPFDLTAFGDQFVHLTNDAIQKDGLKYGKHQPGNKLSYEQFSQYLRKDGVNFCQDVLPQLKRITKETLRATVAKVDPRGLQHNFELFGLDFMLTCDYQPLLIQVNANPCLEMGCPVLEEVIPELVESVFKLGVDPHFPPIQRLQQQQRRHVFPPSDYSEYKFQLILVANSAEPE